jgi:hypothetical protein
MQVYSYRLQSKVDYRIGIPLLTHNSRCTEQSDVTKLYLLGHFYFSFCVNLWFCRIRQVDRYRHLT